MAPRFLLASLVIAPKKFFGLQQMKTRFFLGVGCPALFTSVPYVIEALKKLRFLPASFM
jgi:hypothetical protein